MRKSRSGAGIVSRVYNKRDKLIPANAVYVGRPSKWGNPFTVAVHGRGKALEHYRTYIYGERQEALREEVKKELKGKDLICWCFPEPCHADILLEIANG